MEIESLGKEAEEETIREEDTMNDNVIPKSSIIWYPFVKNWKHGFCKIDNKNKVKDYNNILTDGEKFEQKIVIFWNFSLTVLVTLPLNPQLCTMSLRGIFGMILSCGSRYLNSEVVSW